MKKALKKRNNPPPEGQEEPEIEFFKGLTRFWRKVRYGTAKNIRMSLTIHIAAHYCVQLMRSFFHLLPLCVVLLLLVQYPEYHQAHRRIAEGRAGGDGVYSQEIIQNASLSAFVTDEELPEGFFPRAGYVFRHLFQKGHPFAACYPVIQAGPPGSVVFVFHDMRPVIYRFSLFLVLLLLADAFRMLYFLRHHDRLEKPVVQPIRDMTSMAETVSANNLSNRIHVAGLKNEMQDLAVVINGMLDRLEVSYESQKQFVSDASHELRTPIAVIQGYADMLRRWGKEDPQVLDEGIEAISQEAATMKDLVQDLLFLARHDKKTLMMEMTTFDPVELLQEIRREAEMVSPQDRFILSPDDHLQLTADRNMIKQVMRILLDNAVKYSPEGSTITMGVKKGGDAAVLTMQDTGEGISSEDLPHIFDRFYRADKARKSETGGHGLGLSIARIIVVAHGGRIHVRSKVGEGTTFTVEIPYEKRESGEARVLEEALPAKPRRFSVRRRMHARQHAAS